MLWHYSDGDPLTGASNAGVSKNRDSRRISGYRIDDRCSAINNCDGRPCRSVVCPSVTLVHSKHRAELCGNISASSNSVGTRSVCVKIMEKIEGILGDRVS